MKEKIGKFLDILKIELIDMEEDLRVLEEMYKTRGQNREITNYVLLENVIVIQREITSLKHIVETVKQIAPETYNSVEELTSDLEKRFREQIEGSDAPNLVADLLKRKLQKVAEYVGTA